MTISLRAAGTLAIDGDGSGSGSTLVVSYPAGIVSTDISILQVTAKPNSGVNPTGVTCATPAGWTPLFEGSSGNTPPSTPEAGTGSVKVWIFKKTGSADSGSFTVTLSNNSTGSAAINTYAGNGSGWNTSAVYGYDNDPSGTYDSNKTVTAINLSITAGDWMLVRSGLANNTGVGTVAVTATGATLSASTVRQSAVAGVSVPDTSHTWFDARDVTVSSGTSTAGPKMTASTTQDGISVFILLREGIRSVSGSETASTLEVTNVGSSAVVPSTTTWEHGQGWTAERMNTYVSDPFKWLLTDSPSVQVKFTGSNPTMVSPYTVSWNGHNLLRGGMRYAGTKIYAPAPGRYIGQVSAGFGDIGTMGAGWYAEYLVQVYPAGSGTPTQKVRSQVPSPSAETSWAWGSVPFDVYLNQNDAVEFVISGTWSAGTSLWAGGSAGEVQILMDLHWDDKWDGSFS